MDKYKIGKEIRRIRKENKKMTLDGLSEKTGFTKGYLSMIENGKTENIPSIETLKKIAKGLDVDYYEFLHLVGFALDPGYRHISKEQFLNREYDPNKENFVEIPVTYRIPVMETEEFTDEEGISNIVVTGYTPEEFDKMEKLPYSLDFQLNQVKYVHPNRKLTESERNKIKRIIKILLEED